MYTQENGSTVAPVTLEEALWRTRSYDTPLSAVQGLKAAGALVVQDGEVRVDLSALAGEESELVLPVLVVVERGSAL